MRRWRNSLLSRAHRSIRGTAALEIALALPFLLLFMGGAVDFGLSYAQLQRLNGAARLGAQAAADAMTGQQLQAGMTADAQQVAVSAVQQALPDLANQLQITVAWDGGVTQTQSTDPGATLTADLPRLDSQSQTLDFRHNHSVWYLQPTFGSADWGQWNSTGAWYYDTGNSTGWSPSTWWSVYPYWDRSNYGNYGYPNGFFTGPAICCGWAFGWWWSGNGDFLVSTPDQWWYRWTNWAPGTAWNQSVNGWYGMWRWMNTSWFYQPDYVQYQSGWAWTPTQSSTGGPVVTVGPYQLQTGTQQQQIASDSSTTTITTRLVRVTVSVPARPVTPALAPILGGRSIVGAGDAAATSTQ